MLDKRPGESPANQEQQPIPIEARETTAKEFYDREDEYPDEGEKRLILSSPARNMILDFTPSPIANNMLGAGITLESKKNVDKMPGEITALCQKAAQLIQEEANSRQESIDFEFITVYPSLAYWANTSGQQIFQWDSIDPLPENTHELAQDSGKFKDFYAAHRIFRPQKK